MSSAGNKTNRSKKSRILLTRATNAEEEDLSKNVAKLS